MAKAFSVSDSMVNETLDKLLKEAEEYYKMVIKPRITDHARFESLVKDARMKIENNTSLKNNLRFQLYFALRFVRVNDFHLANGKYYEITNFVKKMIAENVSDAFSEIYGMENGEKTTSIICEDAMTSLPGKIINGKSYMISGNHEISCQNKFSFRGFLAKVEDMKNPFCKPINAKTDLGEVYGAMIVIGNDRILGRYIASQNKAQYGTDQGVVDVDVTASSNVEIICLEEKLNKV